MEKQSLHGLGKVCLRCLVLQKHMSDRPLPKASKQYSFANLLGLLLDTCYKANDQHLLEFQSILVLHSTASLY